VAYLELQIFNVFYKLQDFQVGGENAEHKMCVKIFSTTFSETFLILNRIDRGINIIVHGLSVN
jgi:hypothetical protein